MSRYNRRRVWVSHTESEFPEEVIILSSHRDCGTYYYRCKYVDTGLIIDIPVDSITSIAHRKSKVVKIKKKLRLVK